MVKRVECLGPTVTAQNSHTTEIAIRGTLYTTLDFEPNTSIYVNLTIYRGFTEYCVHVGTAYVYQAVYSPPCNGNGLGTRTIQYAPKKHQHFRVVQIRVALG